MVAVLRIGTGEVTGVSKYTKGGLMVTLRIWLRYPGFSFFDSHLYYCVLIMQLHNDPRATQGL